MNLMRATLAALVLAGIATTTGYTLSAQKPKSQWDGVYTDAQAERGAALYKTQCADCHGPTMDGKDDAKPLTGEEFRENWNEASIGEIFERIRATMPQSSPGSLTPVQTADIVAAILKKNAFPAGGAELKAEGDSLYEIKFYSTKPQ